MNDPVRYAKRDVYAEVDEEGGKINRLVAVKGQPISPAFADYVDDKDTTTDVNEAHNIARTSSVRRNRAGERQELEHEDYREQVAGESVLAGAPGTEAAVLPVEDLAIEDYDELSVDDVVGELAALEPEQVAAVKAYEAANKDRKGIREFKVGDDE